MKALLSVSALVMLSACSVVGPNYAPPLQNFDDEWFGKEQDDESFAVPQAINLQWWRVFNDPLLERYIHAAVAENYELDEALANVRVARALRDVDVAAFYPRIGATAAGDRSQASSALSSSFTSGQLLERFDVGFDASWELDVFGGKRRALEVAGAEVGAAQAAYEDVLQSVLSDVARNYYEARGLQKQIAITKKNAELLNETLNLVRDLFSVGEASEFDVARAQGEYERTWASLPNLEAELNASIFTLSVLLGQPPESLLQEMKSVKPLPAPPDVVPVGLRSEILRRRPDIRAVERQLAAAVATIGVETADLFPKISITGSLSSQALRFGDLFTADSRAWSFGGLLQWDLFGGGAIFAEIEAAESGAQAALSVYKQTVLEAFADVETALSRYGNELETRRRLSRGVQSLTRARELAQQLFEVGEEGFLPVLDAERELTVSENDLVVSETQSIVKLVSLYTALGGGWEVYAENPE